MIVRALHTLRLSFRNAFPRHSPQLLLLAWFAGQILIGGLLLRLPWCHRGNLDLLDALFTATSATCVTGLAVVSTGSDLTPLGQALLLLLIQCGGLGIATFAALAFQMLGWRLPMTSAAAVEDSMFQRNAAREIRRTFRRVLALVAAVEAAGIGLLFLALLPDKPFWHALWSSAFHGISAFCNAGFALYDDNLVGLRSNPVFLGLIGLLIFAGGLGHAVLYELWLALVRRMRGQRSHRPQELSYHARLSLKTHLGLLLLGAAGILALGLTAGEASTGEKIGGALFQSAAARTAGFNTVAIASLPAATLLWIAVLMFIGGAPGSCAGGVKTTSIAIWLAEFRAGLSGRRDVELSGRRLDPVLVRRTTVLLAAALVWNLLGLFVLLVTEKNVAAATPVTLLFEQISAFGTVGLSADLTPRLTDAGKLWIMATMYLGRLGPLTLAFWMGRSAAAGVRLPEGKVMIG